MLAYIRFHSESSTVSSLQSLTACDPADLRNARSAVLEGLPHMLSSMTLLWAALKREETVGRGSEGAKSSRQATSSVYFRSTKVRGSCTLPFRCVYLWTSRGVKDEFSVYCVNSVC